MGMVAKRAQQRVPRNIADPQRRDGADRTIHASGKQGGKVNDLARDVERQNLTRPFTKRLGPACEPVEDNTEVVMSAGVGIEIVARSDVAGSNRQTVQDFDVARIEGRQQFDVTNKREMNGGTRQTLQRT